MKNLKLLVAGLVLLSFTTSASASVPNQTNIVTLKLIMTSYSDQMASFYTSLKQGFESANPNIKVEIELVPRSDVATKVKNSILAGESPDIVNNDEFLEEASAALLYRADQLVTSEVLKDFFPTLVDNSKYKGTAYALPASASTNAFAWNTKLLKSSGVKKAPTSWTSFLTAAKAIKKKHPDIYPYCLPLDPTTAVTTLTTWGGLNGGRLYSEKSGKYLINTKDFKGGIDFLKTMADQKLIQPNPSKTDNLDPANGCWALFAAGKVAMIESDPLLPGWLKSNGGSAIEFRQGEFPVPSGKKSISVGTQEYFKGFRANGRQVEIQKFLNFLFEPNNYQGYLQAAGAYLPSTKSVGQLVASDSQIAPFIKQLSSVIFPPTSLKSWAKCESALTGNAATVLANTNRALTNMQAKCDAAIRKAS